MRQLTKRQREILEYIVSSIRGTGRFPSYREIGRRFKLNSPATVSQHLNALVKKGFLSRVDKKLVLAPQYKDVQGIPIVGKVPAGSPIMAVENREGYLDVSTLFPDDVHFAVRVSGDSMRDAGIFDGDYVIVRHEENVRDGDIVVAYIGEDMEATVKVFKRKGKLIELEPRNPSYESIVINPRKENFRIGGRVVGLIRRLR